MTTSMDDHRKPEPPWLLASISVLGGIVAGIVCFYHGIRLVNFSETAQAGGLCMLGSAIAFGLIANALLRR